MQTNTASNTTVAKTVMKHEAHGSRKTGPGGIIHTLNMMRGTRFMFRPSGDTLRVVPFQPADYTWFF